MFGPHLIIDGTRCDTRKLGDRILVEQILNDYPNAIGMTKIGGPYMFEYQAPDPAYSGVSGLVVIAESHIAIHTFPELDYFTMDIFSCKNFDHETAIEYIRKAFDVQEMDRMLVQRGLSFRGPHHGNLGATDELIAAAQARLDAGIVSKETADPDTIYAASGVSGVVDERAAALARRTEQQSAETPAGVGRMLWPQYGVTPDYGSYGEQDGSHTPGRAAYGAIPLSHNADAPVHANGETLPEGEPVQVNPTASISGLLDKLSATAGPARAVGLSLASWELLARDPDSTIALALNTPVIAAGMRELLVYAVERRYADVVIAAADDVVADLYEALGQVHFAGESGPVATAAGRARVVAFLDEFLATLDANAVHSGADLLRLLGEALPTKAPRKGLLQAAASSGVLVIAPDLSTSLIGGAVLGARGRIGALRLDASDDLVALTERLAARPRLGVVRAGAGAADTLLLRAREVADALGVATPTLTGSVSLGAASALVAGDHHVATTLDPAIALPLLVTGLAQRVPGSRASLREQRASHLEAAEPALA
ncbi:MAG TPA: adenosylmethionine decarboxylase [Ktedonobacterales bacterium]|nr:adenosylmethionine decarboxylase [Ktedonobacterales bacterium]